MNEMDVFRKMKEVLSRPNGWVQKKSREDRGDLTAYCMSASRDMACYDVAGVGNWKFQQHITKMLTDELPERFGSIVAFNDSPSTKQEDVIAAIDAAILRLAEREPVCV